MTELDLLKLDLCTLRAYSKILVDKLEKRSFQVGENNDLSPIAKRIEIDVDDIIPTIWDTITALQDIWDAYMNTGTCGDDFDWVVWGKKVKYLLEEKT